MMKDVTIITFDEMERIRHDIDNMIDEAKDGAYEEVDGITVCKWLLKDLYELREKFS